ncbi:TPA: hypothetical protein QIZ88_000581 [Escherichia coli]|nr:hypothetical protein [Escherichia coli]
MMAKIHEVKLHAQGFSDPCATVTIMKNISIIACVIASCNQGSACIYSVRGFAFMFFGL